MIEVYALSNLKKTTKKVAKTHDCLVTEVFDTNNWLHQEWIEPLVPNTFYRGKVEYSFCAGTEAEFEEWRRCLCFLTHERDLEEVTEARKQDPNLKLYPLLSCSTTTTYFGTEVCRRIYKELVEEWPKIILSQEDDIDELIYFTTMYHQWTKCFYLGSLEGCVELF